MISGCFKLGLYSSIFVLAALFGTQGQAQSVEQELRQLRQLVEESTQALEAATARIEELERQQGNAGTPSIRAGRASSDVELQVYGHLNQAFLYAGNGETSRFDIVDNDNSGSRLGFRAKYDPENSPWSAGTRLELGFEVNTTDELTFSTDGGNGTNAGDSDFLTLRWANLFFNHEDYGTINLGFGETATQGVAERDLSGTTLIAESDVDDTGGELQFSGLIGGLPVAELGTGFEVDDFFSNLDGDRDSAVSYHSPRIGGVQLKLAGRVEDVPEDDGISASTGVNFAPDASLNYKAEFAGYEIDGAVGWRREPDAIVVNDNAIGSNVYLGSVSALAPFGTNLTVGGGVEVFNTDSDTIENENFFYVKLGQRLDLFDMGETRLSVDFFRGEDNSAAGILGEQTEAISFGGGIVQVVKPLGAEVYLGLRYYDVDLGIDNDASAANNVNTDGLFTILSGARVRF